jgi:hypothetical protein
LIFFFSFNKKNLFIFNIFFKKNEFLNLRKLELDYAKIQATTKINTYDELMQAFIEIEEKNFKAFKFINELCNQIETLESQISSLKSNKKNYFINNKILICFS